MTSWPHHVHIKAVAKQTPFFSFFFFLETNCTSALHHSPLFSAVFLIINYFDWRITINFHFLRLPRNERRTWGRTPTPSTTGDHHMVTTLAIVGLTDVQEEWDRKRQLFCDG